MGSKQKKENSKFKQSWFACGIFFYAVTSRAMIKNSLVVHNSRNETITVEVYNSQAESLGTFTVYAKAVQSISIEDTVEGTDWFDAYDSSGRWIKRGSASGTHTNFDWWVD